MTRTSPSEVLFPSVDPLVKRELDRFADLLLEVLAFGTRTIEKSLNVEGKGDYVVPSVYMFRNILELLGGMHSLLRESWIDSCHHLARGVFEADLYLEYLLADDIERRGYAYLVWDIQRELKTLRKLDPDCEEGRRFRAIIAKDKLVANWTPNVPENTQRHRVGLEELLAQPGYAEAEVEYQRLRASGMRNPEWYSLWNGKMRTVSQLASSLKLDAHYDIVYRSLSKSTHALSLHRGRLYSSEEGHLQLPQLRLPFEAQKVTKVAALAGMRSIRALIQGFSPSSISEYQAWYGSIRNEFSRLTGPPVIIERD